MASSLWGAEFEVETTVKKAKKVKEKLANKNTEKSIEKQVKDKKLSIESKLALIKEEVNRILGKYKENTVVIKTRDELHSYIDKAILNNEIAIDTETNNSLDPLTCKLMGPCIYTPGEKNAYIPLNHVDINTRERLPWQLTEDDVREEFSRLSSTNIIMHNGKFDYKVIKCTCTIPLKIYWDTMIAAQVLNENEPAGLKFQYKSKIDNSIEKYDIEHLFQGLEYAIVDPDIFALYAATDAYMTYMLFKYQEDLLYLPENKGLLNIFSHVEMPVVEVTAEMELYGVSIDTNYANNLSSVYNQQYTELENKLQQQISAIEDKIQLWRLTPDANKRPVKKNKKGELKEGKSKSEQLTLPINLGSPTQLAILLYDILEVPEGIDDKSPRGTGEEILEKIGSKYDIKLCKDILELRRLGKLIGTYIDKIPLCVNQKDDRLHASFNQMGVEEKAVRTGRMSSTDPNLQNIPSHDHLIRGMFRAKPGYVLVGSDYSAQEPRLLAVYSKDEGMYNAYKEGKDLYAVIAQLAYHNNYEDNLEFKNGELQPDGKKRRNSAKSILLGIMYGRGVASIAEQIKGTKEEAQKILDSFFTNFPAVKTWIEETYSFARKHLYVEDIWGRRRRLPDLALETYVVKNDKVTNSFNPLLHSKNKFTPDDDSLVKEYKKKIYECKSNKEKVKIKAEAKSKDITIIDNGGKIAQAERQCVNSRIQGGAASMTKLALRKIYDDQFMKERDAHLIIAVHDELLMECPIEYAKEVADRLAYDMVQAAYDNGINIPMKCDADIFTWWYQDQLIGDIKKDLENLKIPLKDLYKDKYNFLTEEQISSFNIN